MILKRVTAAVAAAVTAFTMCALSACTPKCEHQFRWTVRTEATCVAEGVEQGVCGLCGHVEERAIPVTDEHQYGEWQITTPTEQQAGKAVKVCALSSGHTLEVTLPAITAEGTGYDSSAITTPSTVTKEGVRTFVLKHDEGDIIFNVSLPIKKIESVYDAVELGSTSGSLVRSASGRLNTDTTRYQFYNFMYEFGENYTHIKSESGANNNELEVWASLDENGDIYAVRLDGYGNPGQDTSADIGFMNGYPFTIAYAFSQYYYGAEHLLSGLYDWGQLQNPNKDFHEEIKTKNGVNEYTFGFSTYGALYLSEINVSFTLDDSGAIDTLNVITNDYDASSWELDPETEVGTITADSPSGIEVIEIKTVLKSSSAGQEEPQNPYPQSAFRIKSFDILKGSDVITDEDIVSVDADARVEFDISNIEDFSAGANDLSYDPLTFYRRTENGDELIRSIAESGNENLYAYESGGKILFRSRITGEMTIVIKTTSGSFTRLLNLDVKKIPPALGQLIPTVYEYGDKAYVWNSVDGSANVYAGEELLFKAEVPVAVQSYVDATINMPQVRTRPAGVQDSDFSITETEAGQIFRFVAEKPGTYTLRLVSALNSARYCNLIINVLEVPDVTAMLTGVYAGSLQYPQRSSVQVEFTPETDTEGKLTVTMGTLGTQTLSYEWDGHVLTTEHYSGREDFEFTLSINEAYKLVLTHPTGVGEGELETIVLNRPIV